MSDSPTAPPIFVIGMPRSGTTLVFEILARHHALGWLSSHQSFVPGVPAYAVANRLVRRFSILRKRRRLSSESHCMLMPMAQLRHSAISSSAM